MNVEQLVNELQREGIQDERLLSVMANISRERFISDSQNSVAYENRALPIDCGQTISQPYIVALMSEAMELQGDESVLEIGTGCGYQTAILAQLAGKVTTIERWSELSVQAQKRLASLGVENVRFLIGDGTEQIEAGEAGAGELFDAIMVTAAATKLPDSLKNQLKDPGRIVIPVGEESSQTLMLYKLNNGQWKSNPLCGCRFVKLIGKNAWQDQVQE